MKAEITLENKAKFFAQYWGQKVLSWGEVVVDPMYKWRNIPKMKTSSFTSIILKPLSSISDEDCVLCHKMYFRYTEDQKLNEHSISFVKKYIIEPKEFIMNTILDYLRSKGYALPWMGISVEEMVDAGWIKLQIE